MKNRNIAIKLSGQNTTDGAGVRLKRFIGTQQISFLDPFLLLDEFKNDDPAAYMAGFPNHPHRGFETVSYMIAGKMRHGDSRGNSGLLVPGSAQWMTAGRGIIHSEMPEMGTDGVFGENNTNKEMNPLLWGYQLWVNLPAAHKMTDPRYQDIPPEKIPEFETDDFVVRLVAGSYEGVQGAAETFIPVHYFDVIFKGEGVFEHAFPTTFNALLVGVHGSAEVDGAAIREGDIVVFGEGDKVQIQGKEGTRVLFIAGEPIGETVARYGPFVMNTKEEIEQAFVDYQAGVLA
ncbi:MAG TPA: pirin family protein [Turneriella sp.]|nr:pirin family protein [Turneriella sp.]